MRPHLHKPVPEAESDSSVELLLDAEDDLVPLTSTAEPSSAPVESADATASEAVTSGELSPQAQRAVTRLAWLVASAGPVFGWRRWVYVVSGVCLPPVRSERELRDAVRLLMASVGSADLDP